MQISEDGPWSRCAKASGGSLQGALRGGVAGAYSQRITLALGMIKADGGAGQPARLSARGQSPRSSHASILRFHLVFCFLRVALCFLVVISPIIPWLGRQL